MGQLFLDSADLETARLAAESGVVSGITTNPTIMASHAGRADAHPEHLHRLLVAFPRGPVFIQLTAGDKRTASDEAAAIVQAAGDDVGRVVLKLPSVPWLFSLGAELVRTAHEVAFTAVYSSGQVVCAVDAGARWVIPYVDRAARLEPDQAPLVTRLAPHVPAGVTMLAASIKSPAQALAALADGAGAVTTSWDVIEALMHHPLTDSAVDGFRDSLNAVEA
jgi:transaldolase